MMETVSFGLRLASSPTFWIDWACTWPCTWAMSIILAAWLGITWISSGAGRVPSAATPEAPTSA